MKVILFGATGMVGQGVLRECLLDAGIESVLVVGRQPNTAPTKVVITPEHVLSINGKKVFPIGFTIPPPLDGKTPSGKPAFEELRSAGGLFIRTGPMWDEEADRKYFAWDTEWVEREKAYMRRPQRLGCTACAWLKESRNIDASIRIARMRLRKVVRFFKNNPGLGRLERSG